MRLETIDLVRFGHFCGHKIDLPPRQPDYYLLYGENEAGKSTLLRAISALFFGVPAKTPDVHSCKASDLRIGATISEGKKCFSFRRRKGASGTLLNLLDGQIPDDDLAPFLRELDRERFDQFFGLNHQRLREGGEELLRGQGDMGSALFQAAGLLDLRRLLDKLDGDAKELFSPKSRSRTISRIIEEYKLARLEVRKLAISAATVKGTQSELEDAKETLAKLKDQSLSLQQDLVRLRRIESNKPDLARLDALRFALASLEAVPILPPDAGKRCDEAMAALLNANSQIKALTEDTARRKSRIQALPANDLFKAHEKEIEELNAGTSAYIQSVFDRTKRLNERNDATELAESFWKEIWSQQVSEAENLREVYASKEAILELVAEHKGLTADATTAEEELRNVTLEQQGLEEQLASHPEVPDPAGLVAAIEHARSLGDPEQSAAKMRADIERLTQNAQREMRNLARWSGTTQELENLQTPLPATVDQYAREWESRAAECRDLTARRANSLEMIRQKERELELLSSQVSEAGESELSAARARRDELWRLIRASAFDKTISLKEAETRSGSSGSLAGAFADHLRKADAIADVRFANAKDVAIHDRLVKEIASAHAEQHAVAQEIERLEVAERELRQRWSREWNALGSEPLSPSEMKEWMQVRQAVLDHAAQYREKESELQSLQERSALAAKDIIAKWALLGPSAPSPSESLPVLLKMAEAFARAKESARGARDDIRGRLQPQSFKKRKAKRDECNKRLWEWSQKWSPYVRALKLKENSAPEQVARSLAILEKVFDQLKEADRLQHRINRIGDNIKLFENRVAQVVAALDPSCASLSPDAAVKQLHSRLVELGNAATERKTLQDQNDRDAATIAVLQNKAKEAAATLERLKALANCRDDDDGSNREGESRLKAIITLSVEKSDKKAEYERIAAGLIERNAIADLLQIEQEASAYDLDSLRSEIGVKDERLNNSVDEISRAASRHGELTSDFERLETSEESALQAQKSEDALAQLRPAVAQYLRLRLAFEVLQQAIESYREKHQGPILSRASELFSRLTLGGFSGLSSDFGEDDKPVLVAIRRSGERVYVDGLSDGTCDQLYLALRLAAIEHHVATVAPCPVIFDDLLINSDDARASAALDVIGELAKRTQVLFFTHHSRLAELGATAGCQVIELGALAATVA